MKLLANLNQKQKLSIILAVGAILRFGGLFWGLPFHFHPDEWNMAAAISRLSWETRLDPQFYAYGQGPLYLAYFSARTYNLFPWIRLSQIDVPEAIFFLRFWSALASLGTVFFVYKIAQRITRSPLLAAFLAVFTPGLIQSAHFGTTESWLTFCFFGIIFFCLKILNGETGGYWWTSLFLGIALGAKITAIVFFAPIAWATKIAFIKSRHLDQRLKAVFAALIALAGGLLLGFLTSPYLILKSQESLRILNYEAKIAAGQIPIFYTRQFIKTVPIVFQLKNVFPYTLGWPIFLLGGMGLTLITFSTIRGIVTKKTRPVTNYHLLIIASFLAYFLPQAFLFCKWTRFMTPIFPFFALFATFFLDMTHSLLKSKRAAKAFIRSIVILAAVPGIIFSSIYFRPDIRFQASRWIYQNIPPGSQVLSETGNVVDIPVLPSSDPSYPILTTSYQLSPISFDFYRLDENSELFDKLLDYLENADYIFIPTRRLFANHLRLAEDYPKTARYYELLFSGKLGFEEIKVISPFPRLSIPGFEKILFDEKAEETFSVFDHPVIRIYQKTIPLTRQQYEDLFKN